MKYKHFVEITENKTIDNNKVIHKVSNIESRDKALAIAYAIRDKHGPYNYQYHIGADDSWIGERLC